MEFLGVDNILKRLMQRLGSLIVSLILVFALVITPKLGSMADKLFDISSEDHLHQK